MRMNVLVFKMILAQCIGSRFTCLCSIALVTTASPEWSSTGALCFSGLLDFDSYFFSQKRAKFGQLTHRI